MGFLKSQSPPRRAAVPLGALLLATSLGLTILAAGIIGLLSYRSGRWAIEKSVLQLGAEIATRIGVGIGEFLGPSRRIAEANADALGRGAPDSRDQAGLVRYFWGQLQLFGTVSSIYFGNDAGGLANAGREGEKGSQYAILTDRFAAGRFRKFATDDSGRLGAIVSSLPDFDSRKRSWYQNAVSAGDTVWSSPYILFTGQDLAISASRPVRDGHGQLLGVVSIDVFLSQLGSLLAHLSVGRTGQSFVMERSGLLIATSTGEAPFMANKVGSGFVRTMAEDSADPVTRLAARILAGMYGGNRRFDGIQEGRTFDFREGKSRYLGQVGLFRESASLDWLVVTVFPENDFIGGINADFRITGLLICLVILAAALANIAITRRITLPITDLSVHARNLGIGDWTGIRHGQSRIRELSVLSNSFAEMAGMLKTTVEGLRLEVEERKSVQAALVIARDLADSASRAKSEFIANITHEVRTPLTAMLGFTELLMNTTLDDAQRKQLKTIEASERTLLGIVNDVLDFSSMESGALRLEPRMTDLGKLLDEVASRCGRSARDKNLAFVFTDRPSFPGSAEVDTARLRQVLTNLLDNAVKFTERGGVELAAHFNPGLPGMGKVGFSVRDTGIGMSEEHMAKLMQPFSQVDGSLTRRYGGVGLSLYISRLLVQKMGGTIRIQSEPGKGSVFEFSIDLSFGEGDLDHNGDLADAGGDTPWVSPAHAGAATATVDAGGDRADALPTGLIDRLREAYRGGDIGQLLSILEELKGIDKSAAERLSLMLETFDYDAIENWLAGMERTDG